MWFTLALTILATLFFGLLPALRAAQVQLGEALKSSGPTTSASKQSARLRAGLVIGEIALCAAFLPACLLLVESLRHVVAANQWMNEDHVITADLLVHISFESESQRPMNFARIRRAESHFQLHRRKDSGSCPGSKARPSPARFRCRERAGATRSTFRRSRFPRRRSRPASSEFVSPGYFQTIGLPLVKGRFFTDTDREQPVAVISESAAWKVISAGAIRLECIVDCSDI